MKHNTKTLGQNEANTLAAYAVLSRDSRGRKHEEAPDSHRLAFQKDRDRIIHSRAFRRLKEKTQVFVAHHGDHYRNRLTHSLEVAQISRDLARSLGLNEDLAESIGLAHDLGHTPFGHAGETALNECLEAHGMSFEHNQQSRRIVEEIEHVYPSFKGLNLSIEVIEGMMKHETFWDKAGPDDGIHPSLEAQLVNFGDEIAYQNHDIDDGLRSGHFTEVDLGKVELWQKASQLVDAHYGEIEDEHVRIARRVSKMIGLMVDDLVTESSRRIEAAGVKSLADVYASVERLVGFSDAMKKSNKELKDFLMTRLYFHPEVIEHSERGQDVIRHLFEALRSEMELEELRDYLAGMTDRFALEMAIERGFVSP
jgi:dGTPase